MGDMGQATEGLPEMMGDMVQATEGLPERCSTLVIKVSEQMHSNTFKRNNFLLLLKTFNY